MASIQLKGYRNGLLIILDEKPVWDQVQEDLSRLITEQPAFFNGAAVTLQVGERSLNRDDIRKLRDKLSEHDVQLSAILGRSADTIRNARREEIDTEISETSDIPVDSSGELPPITNQETGNAGILVKSTLRSGRIVRHVGHVIVIGDVNPGAQIVSGGDVIVWGRLRGTVHAGANGDDTALVCALDMRPMQLRIANYVAIAPDGGQSRPHPEVASVYEGQIVAEEWGAG